MNDYNIYNEYQILGESVLSILNALEDYSEVFREMFLERGYEDFEPGKWYPISMVLEVVNEIEALIGNSILFEIGKGVTKNAPIPPQLTSIKDAILAAPIMFKLNHAKNHISLMNYADAEEIKDIGQVKGELTDLNAGRIIDTNPYPGELNRGVFVGLLRKFEPFTTVELIMSEKGEKIFNIKW